MEERTFDVHQKIVRRWQEYLFSDAALYLAFVSVSVDVDQYLQMKCERGMCLVSKSE